MLKLFRNLFIAGMAILLITPSVLAGPGGSTETGDPESPSRAHPIGADTPDGEGLIDQESAGMVSAKRVEPWRIALRAYLTLLRAGMRL